VATKKTKAVEKPRYELQSKLRFTPKQAEQENKWAMELYESRKKFVEHVQLALQTRSPTRRRELYQQWRGIHGDDLTRDYAKYAESIYQGGDTKLLDRFEDMTRTPPEPIPDYMILKDGNET
jgi:hypothetical protein